MDNYIKRNLYFPMVDVLKLLCAVLVVVIHSQTGPFSSVAAAVTAILAGQAVPFFMIVSGFFVGLKMNQRSSATLVAWKCAKNWLLLYFAWSILWFPYFVNTYLVKYPDAGFLYYIFLLIRRVFLAGQGVYWYILILAEATILLGVFVRYGKERTFYFLAALGLILGFIYDIPISDIGMDQLNSLIYKVFSWSNNVIMKGIPFVAIGYYASQHLESHKPIKPAVLISAYLVLLGSMFVVYKSNRSMLCLIYPVQAGLLFLMAIDLPIRNIPKKVCSLCRELSASIYYLHTIFIYFMIDPVMGYDTAIWIKTVIAVFASSVVYMVARKINWRPMCWMLGIHVRK